MNRVSPELEARIGKPIGPNERQVVLSLDGEYRPAPASQSRHLTASVASRYSNLIEKEWQAGCASCTYYRLTALGLELKAALARQESPQ